MSPVPAGLRGECFYCGAPADNTDHLWPYSEGGRLIVAACSECNSLAGSEMFDSGEERVAYVKRRIATRYRAVLAMPDWPPAELAALSGALRRRAESQLMLRDYIRERLDHLTDWEQVRSGVHAGNRRYVPRAQTASTPTDQGSTFDLPRSSAMFEALSLWPESA